MKTAITITIQETDGRKIVSLHHDFKEVPTGMTTKRCVRWMLDRASEKFQEREASKPRD